MIVKFLYYKVLKKKNYLIVNQHLKKKNVLYYLITNDATNFGQ